MPKQSMKSMQAEMKKLNEEYERNKRRMAALQQQSTPDLSLLSGSAGNLHHIPLMDADAKHYHEEAQKNVRGASGVLTGLKLPSSAQQHYGIAKPSSVGRVHVNLTRKPKGVAKPKHADDPRMERANYMKQHMLNAFKRKHSSGGRSQKVRSQRRKRSRTRRH